MIASGVTLANRRLILLTVLSMIASMLLVNISAPKAGASGETVEFAALTSSIGEGGASTTIGVTLDNTEGSLSGTVSVDVYLTGVGDATSGTDFSFASPTTVSWTNTGTLPSTQVVMVTINQDSIDEPDETVEFGLQSPNGVSIAGNTTHTLTINDDDPAPTISVSGATVSENAGTLDFTVTRSGATSQTVTYSYATSDGSATAGSDYTSTSGSDGSIAPGATTDTISVPINDDSIDEPNESFTLTISSPVNATLGSPTTATGTINDNDTAPTISISDATFSENVGTATFTVTRTGSDTTSAITFDYDTSNGTALAGSDYTAVVSGSGSISPGAPGTTTVTVPITSDSVYEDDQTFTVTISNVSGNATIGTPSATGTINDDDTAPTLTINSPAVLESVSGSTLTFTITRTGLTELEATATATSSNGTATAGSDYTSVSQLISVPAGGATNTTTVAVSINNETTYETNETLTVALSAPGNATLGTPSSGTGTINNDDAAPTLTIDSPTLAEDGVTMTFTVTRTGPTQLAATATVDTANGTATAGSDYTAVVGQALNIPAGLTPGTTTFDVDITDDAIDEAATETFTAVLSNPGGATLGTPSTGTGSIVDNDGAPSLTINDVTIGEGGTASFTVTKVGSTALTITVTATTSNGTATQPGDYTQKSQLLTILSGSTTATFTVDTVQDSVDEDDETFTVTLSGATNATIADATGLGTITDNDALPTVSIAGAAGSEGTGTISFTITRTGLTEREVSVTAQTSPDTAIGGTDYTSKIGSVNIPPGGATNTGTFVVSLLEDFEVEGSETFDVTLSAETNATITSGSAVGTIADNDVAGITIAQTDGSTAVVEGGTGDTYTVALTAKPTDDVTVNLGYADTELAALPSSLTFTSTSWNSPQTVTVTGVDDGIDELQETHGITHTLSSSDTNFNGVVGPTVVVTIGDSDSLIVTIGGPTVGAPGLPATFTATVNAGGTGTITYTWTAILDGKQVKTGDKSTFTFTPTAADSAIISVQVGDSQNQNPLEFLPFTVLNDSGNNVFTADIVWLAEEGITKGCNPPDNNEFCPNANVTRAQMAAFLVRFLGLSDDGGGNTFTDDNGSIFEGDIARLAAAGITKGCNPPVNDHFCPNANVTREQMAAFLVRALGLTDDGGGNSFVDDNGSIFEGDIARLAAAGITKGCNPPTNDRFCPTAIVTRGQMAAFLRRADAILNP